jgi:hypothetical protein
VDGICEGEVDESGDVAGRNMQNAVDRNAAIERNAESP